MQRPADHDPLDDELHRAGRLDPHGLFVGAKDLEADHGRRSLTLPDRLVDRRGIGRPVVRADELQSGARALHDEAGHAPAGDGREADPIEVDEDGAGQAVDPSRELDEAGAGIDEALDDRRGVRLPVRDRCQIRGGVGSRLGGRPASCLAGRADETRHDDEPVAGAPIDHSLPPGDSAVGR